MKLTVRQRMRIRGQVLKEDGTPLRNVRVSFEAKRRYVNGGSGHSSGGKNLDDEGRFTEYIDRDRAAYYTITVEYQGQSAESPEILLEEGQRVDGLTLTLKGVRQAPQGVRQAPPKPNIFRPRVPPIPKPRPQPNMELRRTITQRRQEGVWAVNPANRHAYKVISCKTLEEALTKAAEQKAHLVAINDKDEQQWLLDVYGDDENYWIGFTNGLKKEDKKWDNGDPITYTNWDTQKLLSVPKIDGEQDENIGKTYTVLIGVTGKWQQVSEDNPVRNITNKAILEKKDLVIGASPPDEESE